MEIRYHRPTNTVLIPLDHPQRLYRKKPVIVEAIQFKGQGSYDEMKKEWPEFGDKSQHAHCQMADINQIVINTNKGYLTAFIGDYVIKNNKGEFYPCKPDIFGEIYESVWDMVYCDSKGDYVRASECLAVAYGKQSGNGEFQPKRCVGCRGAST